MNNTLLTAALLPLLGAASQSIFASSANDTEANLESRLELISVSASRVEVPLRELGVSVAVVTAADIERLGYSSLLDVMRTLPGVSVSNNGGAGKVSAVYLRGESNYRTLVLLDGVNIADPANTQVSTQFQHLLAQDVERIEVLRGPQGMMYGAGAGGVINIITRKAGSPLELQLTAEGGRYDTRQGSARIAGESARWDYALNVSSFDSDGFNSRTSDLTGERDGYRNRTASAQLGYQLSDSFYVSGQLRQTDSESEFDGCFAGFNSSNECLDEFTQTSYRLSGEYRTADLHHQLSLAQQEIERDSLALGLSSFAVEGAIEEVNYLGSTSIAGGHLSWGAELEQQENASIFESQQLESVGVFSEWRGDMAEKLFYSLGYRRDSLDSEDHNSWRASVAYPVLLGGEQQIKYRASYGTGYRAPSPFETAYNNTESAAPLGPETSRGFELGLDYQLARLLQLELVYFDQQVSDAIIFDYSLGTSGWGAYGQDDGVSESSGVELAVSGTLATDIDWYFNGTWLNTEDTEGAQRLLVPQKVYNLGVRYSLLADRLMLSGNWRREEDRLSPNPTWGGADLLLDEYSKLDINGVYKLSRKVRLNLRAENVLDRDYREVAGYNTAGAAIYAGVQFSL